MIQGFGDNGFALLGRIGTVILAIPLLTVAQLQDNGAVRSTPAAVSALVNESYRAAQRQDYEAARKFALEATTISPKDPSAWFYLGWAYQRLNDIPNAEAAYKTVIEINPRHASAYTNLGVIYGRTGRTEDQIAAYRKQIEVAPHGQYAAWYLGRILATRGEWEEARALAAVAAELTAADPNRWAFLGRTQIKTGHIDEARQSFDRALALPHNAMMENTVAYELADAGFDFDKSWRLISDALGQSTRQLCEPESLADGEKCTAQLRQLALMLDTAGWVLYRQGKTQESEPYLRASFAITPRGENELHMVTVLAKLGRLDEAAAMLAQARVRPSFARTDSRETMRELTKAAGGDSELEAILSRAPLALQPSSIENKVFALVDARGKVIEAHAVPPTPDSLAETAKSLKLPTLAWPGHAIGSIRTIEFQFIADHWSPTDIYVGETLPTPCASVAAPLPILTTQNVAPTQSPSCPSTY
jgi:tetratricopeptide (TPR) repeat protein